MSEADPRRHADFPSSRAPAPRANPMLDGHGEACRRLAQASADGRLAGAWLIGGPKGIGKATLAYRLARHLLAAAPLEGTARLEGDPQLARVASGAHGGLLTVEAGCNRQGRRRGEIVIEDIRRLAPFFHRSAGEGGWRVVVIDGAELMNRSAANAVLKLVEEPPARALAVLVSHAPARLPATLASRCRKLFLRPLAAERVALLLERYLPELAADERLPLARLAEGSIGRAMALAELGGLALYREMLALVGAAPAIDPVALHGLADRLGRHGNDAACRTVLDFLASWLARLVRQGAAGGGFEGIVAGEGEAMAKLAGTGGSLDRWVEVWEKTVRLRERADSLHLDRKQVVLAAFGALEAAARN